MCDSTLNPQSDLPIGYAARRAVRSMTIDQYLERLPQSAGRQVVDRYHTQTNAGEMVVQRVSQTVTRPDGSVHGAVQLQFFVVRFNALHVCFLEFPSELAIGSARGFPCPHVLQSNRSTQRREGHANPFHVFEVRVPVDANGRDFLENSHVHQRARLYALVSSPSTPRVAPRLDATFSGLDRLEQTF